MAIALLDDDAQKRNSQSSGTLSIECEEEDGRLLALAAHYGSVDQIDDYSATYGGDALKNVRTLKDFDSPGSVAVRAWEMNRPPTGTDDLVVSTGGSNRYFVMYALSFTGVYEIPTNIIAENTGEYGTSDQPSVDIITDLDDSWVIDIAMRSINNTTWTAGAGQTIFNQYSFGSGFQSHVAASRKTVASAGSTTMSYANTLTGNWVHLAMVLHPAGDRMKMIGVNKIITS